MDWLRRSLRGRIILPHLVVWAGIACVSVGNLWALTADEMQIRLHIELFFQPSCGDCRAVREGVLADMGAMYGDWLQIEPLDTTQPANYGRLALYQQRFEIDPQATVVIVAERKAVFAGRTQVEREFPAWLESAFGRLLSGEPLFSPLAEADRNDALPPPQQNEEKSVDDLLLSRSKGFGWAGVALAGLIDGLNPCAISTLVFFISVLAVMKIKGRRLLAIGAVFCLSSFAVYLGIGLGLFRVLYEIRAVGWIQRWLDPVLGVVLIILGGVSFADAWRFHRSGKAADIQMKLPARLQSLIHRVVRGRLGMHRLYLGSALAGVTVTLLESVCTGQVYLPTLAMVARGGHAPLRVLLMLLLYNISFIIPLVLALVLAYRGTRTEWFLHWSRRHVVRGKLLMGSLFWGMAALLLLLAIRS